jgi:hypothetical protein
MYVLGASLRLEMSRIALQPQVRPNLARDQEAPEVVRSVVADAGHICGRLAADPLPGHPQIAAFLRANAAKLRVPKHLQRGESRGLSHPLQPVETAGIEPASAIA